MSLSLRTFGVYVVVFEGYSCRLCGLGTSADDYGLVLWAKSGYACGNVFVVYSKRSRSIR